MKLMASTATVATRPPTCSTAAMAPAMSIWLITQPPKMSPAALVSAGMAMVRMVMAPRGSVNSLIGVLLRLLGPTANRLFPVTAAQRDIFVVAADVDLIAFGERLAVGTEADDHGGLGAAMADGAHLAQRVGDGEQLG